MSQGQELSGEELAREQMRIAREYPHEYVVMLGTEVVLHTPDRKEALKKNREVIGWPNREYHPVVVPPEPERSLKVSTVERGRTCVGPGR